MKYLLDTHTCVYFLNGEEAVRDRLLETGVESVSISCVSIAELRYGAHKSTCVEANLARILSLESQLTVFDRIDSALADLFGRLKASLRSNGLTIGDFDLLIACFALVNSLVLVTNNAAHFQHIPGLQIENWRQAGR
ncbi:MAG: PIN domain-containing protein [Candidatus Sumerlaeota bacterium]|nr:PIN domain-containing protein [Candidatus Sumerlaeota bacterium]